MNKKVFVGVILVTLLLPTLALAGGEVAPGPGSAAVEVYGLPALTPMEFNLLAAQADVPLLWASVASEPTTVKETELIALGAPAVLTKYVANGKFTLAFERVYRALVELKRKNTIQRELEQGLPTPVRNDLTGSTPAEKKFLSHIIKIAGMIDALHTKQLGGAPYVAKIGKLDGASQTAFRRNSEPWCAAPLTESSPFCNALPTFPKRTWDTYPAKDIAAQGQGLCKALAALPDGTALMNPFVVVRREADKYVAVPYSKTYAKEMKAIALELRAAAATLDEKNEAALKKYLLADATAFETNNWEPADEAWGAMSATNSKWYLRVAPDEVYWDLCQAKAGFQVSFALIDKSSLELQKKLTPLRDEMEQMLAALPESGYQARKVGFHMPDFIEIIINAGDARPPLGATIGESLPNWGKVAEEGRGRTVVMTNLYQDPVSRKMAHVKAASLLTAESLKNYVDNKLIAVIGIVLHEATHNLGPYSDYKIGGKGPVEIFGGHLASTLEELKAQTGALLYVELLRKKGIVSDEMAKQIYTDSIVWAFGHISQGMLAASGNPKTYSQLAAVQVGWFMDQGALSWDTAPDSVTGIPTGKFNIHYEKMVPAVEALMAKVVKLKAAGTVAAGKELVESYVKGSRKNLVHMEDIASRLLKFPKASMVYSVNW